VILPDERPQAHIAAEVEPSRARLPVMRGLRITAGVVMLIIGLITLPTPLPIGFVFTAIGLFMLTRDSERARETVRWARRKIALMDWGLRKVEPRLPRAVARMVYMTDPHRSEMVVRAVEDSSSS